MDEIIDLKYKNFKEILISVFVGFTIGMSVIVPGISGSTIAIVMKVYDKMMYAFSNLFKRFALCFLFLIPIGIGVAAGFGIGFVLVNLLLGWEPFITICFFVGLMAGTYPILLKEIQKEEKTMNRKIFFIAGVLVPLVITLVSMYVGGDNSLTSIGFGQYALFFVIGILISLTQIIPGLSATVVLMIFGYYTALMDGVGFNLLSDFKLLMVYVVLVIGFVVGLLLFSKLINKLLTNYKVPFFFVICGLSFGSMLSVFFGNECLDIYGTWNNGSMTTELLFGILAFVIGFAATFLLYLYDKKRDRQKLAE